MATTAAGIFDNQGSVQSDQSEQDSNLNSNISIPVDRNNVGIRVPKPSHAPSKPKKSINNGMKSNASLNPENPNVETPNQTNSDQVPFFDFLSINNVTEVFG